MKIGAKKLQLNKWQFRFVLEKRPPWLIGFAPHILIHLAKVHIAPKEGQLMNKDLYRGFIFDYTLPTYRYVFRTREIRIAKINWIYWVDVFYNNN